jgi:hypothetical protein
MCGFGLIPLLLIAQLDSVELRGESYKTVLVCPDTVKAQEIKNPITIRVNSKGELFWSEYFLPVLRMSQGNYIYYYSPKAAGFVKIDRTGSYIEVRHSGLCLEIRFGKIFGTNFSAN